MAKKHSVLTNDDLHNPRGILVHSTGSMLVMSQSMSTATASFHFIPNTTDTYTLGNAARAWKELFVSTSSIKFADKGGNVIQTIKASAEGVSFISSSGEVADISGSVISGSKLHIVGDTFIGGDLTLGDADTDSISISADLTSNLIPNADGTYDLGSSSKGWNDLHLGSGGVINLDGGDVTLTHAAGKVTLGGDGAVEFDFANHEMTNVDVNSGAIDGTAIGAASHTTGKFTTLIATGDVDLGDATGDTITATGRFDSALVPSTDSARDLGTTGLYWANAYIDSITTTGDVTVNGSLDVNGTLTTIDSTNLRVADRFIIVASGSTSGDSGLIANTGAGGIGSAFFYDDSASRWALTAADDTSGSATTATPRQYLVSVSQSAAPPDDWEGGATQNPSDFGTDAATRRGMIYVQTSDHAGSRTLAGDIWIWS